MLLFVLAAAAASANLFSENSVDGMLERAELEKLIENNNLQENIFEISSSVL